MKLVRLGLSTLTLLLLFLGTACDDGGDDGGNAMGGSCTMGEGDDEYCYEVEEEGYDVKTECSFLSGKWSASACDTSLYATKCVQETEVSEDDGPSETVNYVYYFKADGSFGCLGDETDL
ncbi:MAG: hypothetical protein JXR76_12315 [Deltaproteobacteria bacterium]|nr:hypothetical protein [Deltaproteobacteria bacterium]